MADDDNPSQLSPSVGDNSTVIDFDALGDVEDFVAPEDLVGEDFANELQSVLEEARGRLDQDPDAADPAQTAIPSASASLSGASDSPAEKEPEAESEGEFESPADVLSEGESTAAGGAAAIDEETAACQRDLEELLNLSASGEKEEASSDGASDSLDSTTVQAQAMTQEFKELAAIIQKAVAPAASVSEADSATSRSNAEDSAAGLAAGSLDPPAVPASAGPKAQAAEPAPSGQTLGQLDEFLAGHADHAVADAFETVNDVIAEAQAVENVADAMAVASASDAASMDDEFSSPEQVLAPQPPRKPDVAQAAAQAVPINAKSAPSPAVAAASDPPAMAPAPVAEVSRKKFSIGGLVRQVVVVGAKVTRTTCATLNRPLRNASDSTRKTIGYVGLLTVANGSLLILGKMLFSLMG